MLDEGADLDPLENNNEALLRMAFQPKAELPYKSAILAFLNVGEATHSHRELHELSLNCFRLAFSCKNWVLHYKLLLH
jgi:L-arabinose isomerase